MATRDVPGTEMPERAAATEATAESRRTSLDGRSIGELIRRLGNEGSRLLGQELRLAKAEMREKLDVYERNVVKMIVGGVLLLGATLVLFAAVNRGLTVLLATFMDPEIAVWLSPLILAAVAGLIGWTMIRGAQRTMARESVVPRKAVDVLQEEKEWVKREAREMRHG